MFRFVSSAPQPVLGRVAAPGPHEAGQQSVRVCTECARTRAGQKPPRLHRCQAMKTKRSVLVPLRYSPITLTDGALPLLGGSAALYSALPIPNGALGLGLASGACCAPAERAVLVGLSALTLPPLLDAPMGIKSSGLRPAPGRKSLFRLRTRL